MEWLFFQSQSHRPIHVRREVFVAPSRDPEIQLRWPFHSPYELTFPKSVSEAVILCALIEDVFRSLRPWTERMSLQICLWRSGPEASSRWAGPDPQWAIAPWDLRSYWKPCTLFLGFLVWDQIRLIWLGKEDSHPVDAGWAFLIGNISSRELHVMFETLLNAHQHIHAMLPID